MITKVISLKSLLSIFGFLVLTTLIGYVIINSQERNGQQIRIYSHQSGEGLYIPYFSLQSFNHPEFKFSDLNARLNILIYFSLSDCPGCLYEAMYWGMASASFNEDEIQIVGITSTSDKTAVKEFCEEYHVDFPIIIDKLGVYKEKIISIKNISDMLLFTPVKIFSNQKGRILAIEGPIKDMEEQEKFLEKIEKFLNIASQSTVVK